MHNHYAYLVGQADRHSDYAYAVCQSSVLAAWLRVCERVRWGGSTYNQTLYGLHPVTLTAILAGC